MNKKGFTLIEMLTTTAILVIVFGLLAIIFGRATNIHKIVRSGGDAENFGIYLINTMVYGPGINREKGLVGAKPFQYGTNTSTTLTFQGSDGQYVRYILDTSSHSITFSTLPDGGTWSTPIDLKPTWATDRQLEVLLPDSQFIYYDVAGAPPTTPTVDIYAVEIRFVLKNTLQNPHEAVTLSRFVRIRNQIDF